MAAPVISISSDSSESVETLVISPVAPVVEMTIVAPPIGLRDLIPYLDSDSDSPIDMASLEYISPLPTTSPFLCIDSLETSDSSDGPPSQDPYVVVIARWRSKVASRPSSSSEFPIAPVTIPPGIHRRPAILIRPEEVIPFGRPYRTHPNGTRRVLITRKRVRPIPARRLAWRRVSPRSLDYRSSPSSSSSDSSLVHSSGFDAPVSGSLAPTRADLLPPHKRFRDSYSSEASMEEDAEVGTTEAEVGMELGIGDGIDSGDRVDIDPRDVREDTEEYEAETSARDTIELGIDPMSASIVDEEFVEPAGEYSSGSSGTRDGIVRSFEDMLIDLDDVVREFYHHMSEVRIDRIVEIETVQRQLEADQLIASGERASMVERIESLRLENLKVRALLGVERDRVDNLRRHMSHSQEEFHQSVGIVMMLGGGMTPEAIKELDNRRVEEALDAYEATRATNALDAESQSQNGSDRDNGKGGNGNGENGNGGNGNGRNENPNENDRGARPAA
ncbi:hypothetical protein Tco_0617324 [Tanacetum coccineum]